MLNNSAEVLRGVTGHSARAVPHLLKVMLLETGFRVSETWQTLVADNHLCTFNILVLMACSRDRFL